MTLRTISRAAVIGIGSIGKRHFENLRMLEPSVEIAVCHLSGRSPTPSTIAEVSEEFYELETLLRYKPQAAIIATPASTHQKIAEALTLVGADLLIEKPITHNLTSARQLHSALQASSSIAMVGYNLRFRPGLRMVRSLVQTGEIGKPLSVRAEVGQYLPDWRPGQDFRTSVSATPELGGGVLLELSHELDYLQWIFGVPNSVFAVSSQHNSLPIQVEELVELSLLYNDGPVVSVHLDFLDRGGFRFLRIIGEEASITWDGISDCVKRHDQLHPQGQVLNVSSKATRNDTYLAEMQHFMACVRGRIEPEVTAADAVQVMATVEWAQASLESGLPIDIKSNDKK